MSSLRPAPPARMRARRARAAMAAVAIATMLGTITASTLPGTAATSNVVVAMDVPSATNLDASGCAAGQANRTAFGTVLPGTSAVTGLDCSVLWGSSNDTATLRAYQSNGGLGTAMTKPPTTTTQTLSGSRTMDLEMATAAVGWVVAESSGVDNLRKTTDGGATWTNVANPFAAPLKGLAVVSTTVAWMSEGWGNQVARTTDGANWVATTPLPAAARIHDLEATSSTVAWAAGYTTPATGGQIWKTIDGGTTWTNPCNNCTGGEINDLHMVDATTGWAVTSWGSILKTVDGATFAVQQSFGTVMYAVAAYDTTHAVVAGQDGQVFTTSNGTNWIARSLPINVPVKSIAYHADGTIWAVGALGSVQRSSDHGVTWQVIEQGVESGYIRAMSSPTPTQVNMSTTAAHLMVTTNAGTTWSEAAGAPTDWTGLAAVDGALMWRVWQGGLISRTTDGSTWSAQTSGTTQSLHDVVALDRQTVLAFGANGTILRTSNAGTTWTSRSSGTTRTLLDATSPDGNVVYASGTNGTLLRSIDRGLTWTSVASGTTSPLTAVGAWSRDELLVGTGSGALRRSLDGGATWSTPASPSYAPAITGIEAIPGTQTVWVSWDTNVARSTDRFTTYVNSVLPAARVVLSLSATDGLVAVAGREQARMSLTMDGGATWLELDGGTASRVIQGVASLGAYSSYGVGETGQTVRSSAPTTVADYDQPTQSWTNGTGFFGICLKSAPGATPAWPTTGSCPQVDGTNWRAVPDHGATAQAAVASTIAAGTVTSAFQFGIRAPSTQSPGTYIAPITFELTAPAA